MNRYVHYGVTSTVEDLLWKPTPLTLRLLDSDLLFHCPGSRYSLRKSCIVLWLEKMSTLVRILSLALAEGHVVTVFRVQES